eukprot:755293-Prymnesium_polylepis.1
MDNEWEMFYLGLLPRHAIYQRVESSTGNVGSYGDDVKPLQRLPAAPWTTHAYALRLPLARQLARTFNYFLVRGDANGDFQQYQMPQDTVDPSWGTTCARASPSMREIPRRAGLKAFVRVRCARSQRVHTATARADLSYTGPLHPGWPIVCARAPTLAAIRHQEQAVDQLHAHDGQD